MRFCTVTDTTLSLILKCVDNPSHSVTDFFHLQINEFLAELLVGDMKFKFTKTDTIVVWFDRISAQRVKFNATQILHCANEVMCNLVTN